MNTDIRSAHRSTAVRAFFDTKTASVSYLVIDIATRRAAAIDPVLDFDAATRRVDTSSVRPLIDCLEDEQLTLHLILETHVHADHLTAARYLKSTRGGRIATGSGVRDVQQWLERRTQSAEPSATASGFDDLLDDGQPFVVGATVGHAIALKGHTSADTAYLIDGNLFAGDLLLMPDLGSGRADLPGGDARALYGSIRRLLRLPEATVVHVAHDYPPAGRDVAWRSTVGDHRRFNVHIQDGVDIERFEVVKRARDASLATPSLMGSALPFNAWAGAPPPAFAR
jgi:glyoxylase-like metal-dependent hydrolase (beta-lactamase superfamily II)